MDDDSSENEGERKEAVENEFQEIFYDIEDGDETKTQEQQEREKRLIQKQKLLEQMLQEQNTGETSRTPQAKEDKAPKIAVNIEELRRLSQHEKPSRNAFTQHATLGAVIYDSPSNREIRNYHERQKETYSTNRQEKGKNKGMRSNYHFPAPNYEDPLVRMQIQLEACKNKETRTIKLEVSQREFANTVRRILDERGIKLNLERVNMRVIEENTKRAFLPYIQEWVAGGKVRKYTQELDEDNEETKDQKAYLAKIKETILDLKTCELYPMISGYRETETRAEDKLIFTIHGNRGCEIWFKRLVELSRMGHIWELNEEGRELRIMRGETEYNRLTRRYGRYKRARATAIAEIRSELTQNGEEERYIGWKEAHIRVQMKRAETGYSSEMEENKHNERARNKGHKGAWHRTSEADEWRGKGEKRHSMKLRKTPYSPHPTYEKGGERNK